MFEKPVPHPSGIDRRLIVFENTIVNNKRGRPRSSDRLRVEDCAVIDVCKVPPLVLRPPRPVTVIDATDLESLTGHELTVTFPDGEQLDLTLFTITTRPYYGGLRCWFVCPACGTRCVKLYSPAGSRSPFACRRCWGLVYGSQYDRSEEIRFLRRWIIRPPSMTASAQRQRSARLRRKLAAYLT